MLAVLFTLGDQRYGLDAAVIEQIVPAIPLRTVPGAPPAVAGVFSFRGQVAPVIDLAHLALGRPARAALSSRFMMVRYPLAVGGERILGLLAERVNEVQEIPESDIGAAGIASPGAPFLGPVAEMPQGLVQIVTLQNLLPPPVQALLFSAETAALVIA